MVSSVGSARRRCTKKGRCVSVRLTAITLVWIVLLTYAQELIEIGLPAERL